jgi:hypothetical protein
MRMSACPVSLYEDDIACQEAVDETFAVGDEALRGAVVGFRALTPVRCWLRPDATE